MVDAPTLRCPVCRARQPHGPTCRRCQADLRLLVAALGEVERLQHRHAAALAAGEAAAARQAADALREMLGSRAEQAILPPDFASPPTSHFQE